MLAGCATTAPPQTPDSESRVAPFTVTQVNGSYEMLEDQLRRFSARFGTRVALTTDQIMANAESPAEQLAMLSWRNVSLTTIVEMAVGPDVVTNLLDMIVVTTLTRLVLQDYWLPEVLGEDVGQALLETYRILEDDIWQIADQVLTSDQQASLRMLIAEWHRDNPDQNYPWYVRLDEFSGPSAADLRRVEQSGGLLGIRAATQSVQDIEAVTERLMFYLQQAPQLTMNRMEENVLHLLQSQSVQTTVEDVERFIVATEGLVALVAQLPSEQFAVIDQFMRQLSVQRAEFFEEFEGSGPQAEAVVRELRQSLETFERILELLRLSGADANGQRKFDIRDYRDFAAEAAGTAQELRLLVEAAERVLEPRDWENQDTEFSAAVEQVVRLEDGLVVRLAILSMVMIAFFFSCLLAYKLVAARISSRHEAGR
jgi:hypothetical protein